MDSITFFRSLLTHYLPENVFKKLNSGYFTIYYVYKARSFFFRKKGNFYNGHHSQLRKKLIQQLKRAILVYGDE